MKTFFANGPWPKLQRHWDLRAACNFIGGGTGSGLILLAAAAAAGGHPCPVALAAGLVSVGFGLTMVLLEIGRPWRALNVFFHPQTSWMTREGVLALPLFATGVTALLIDWLDGPLVAEVTATVIAAVAAAGFLYCQARILRAAKGIPAWREAALTPYMLATGLTEGIGAFLLLGAFIAVPVWAVPAALALAAGRYAAWRRYRAALVRHGAPAASLSALDTLHPAFPLLHGVAALVLAVALAWPALAPGATTAAGLLLVAGGWLSKRTIVIRAAATRGFAIPRTPVRGRGTSQVADRPGWVNP
jgi:phenylacetyl-CoA:acceptor oxidoreductase 26-kDa subunit